MLDGFRHEALPYRGRDAFTTATRDVVRDGLDRDDRLIVLADSGKLAAVTEALDVDAADVTFVPLDEHGRNPTRVTTMLQNFQALGDTGEGRRCLGVAETVLGSQSAAALAEAQLCEFLYNDEVVAPWPMTLICLYDVDAVSDDAVAVMRQSHTAVRGQESNPDFRPDYAATLVAQPLDPPPPGAETMTASAPTLGAMREFVRAHAVRSALDADRVDDLVLAANEVVTNSVRHGGGRATVTMWPGPDGAICEVRDAGVLADPFAGRFAPTSTAASGRGLWLVNHLCDLVCLRSSEAGTTIRLHVDRRRERYGLVL